MTKKEMFAQILSHLTDSQEREFVEHEIELLERKNTRKGEKMTPAQEANLAIKQAIVDFLTETGKPMTVSEMLKEIPQCAELTNQKVSSLVSQLVREFVVVRTEEKGKAFFAIP